MNWAENIAIRAIPALTSMLLLVGARLVLKRWILSALVVAPFVILTPWASVYAPPTGASTVAAAAAAVWVWLLMNEMPGRRDMLLARLPMALSCLAVCLGVLLAPQVLLVTTPVAVYYAVRRNRVRSIRPLIAMVIVPLLYESAVLLVQRVLAGRNIVPEAVMTILSEGWTARPWFQVSGIGIEGDYLNMYNTLFYLPVIVPILVMSRRYLHAWWFAPTFWWAALVCAGPLVFERCACFYYGQPLQMGVITVSGLVAALALTNRPAPDTEADSPQPNSKVGLP